MQQNTLSLSEETTAYLGGILESVKAFYIIPSASVSLLEKPATASVEKRPVAAVEKRPVAAAEKKQVRQETKWPKEAKKQAKDPATGAEDDLTAIAGIGPALQRKLKEHGIRSFAQIAALSDEDIERLEGSIIKFSGRIKRDDWIRQARRFSEEMR